MKFLMLNAQQSGLYLYIIVIASTFISWEIGMQKKDSKEQNGKWHTELSINNYSQNWL